MDFCLGLKSYQTDLQVEVVCAPRVASGNGAFFTQRQITPTVFSLSGNTEDVVRQIGKGALATEQTKTSLKSKIMKWVMSSSPALVAREQLVYLRMKKYKAQAVALFEKSRPDVVLSLSDRSHDYIESSVLWAAKQAGVKVVLPYVAQYNKDTALEYRVDGDGNPLPELKPFWPFSLYKLYTYLHLRDQVYRGFFFQAPFVMNANRRSGTLSAFSWWVGNGNSDVACVDSEHTTGEYLENGVDAEKIRVVGHISYDDVFRSYKDREKIRRTLVDRYSFDPDKPLIVLSVPQYAEQGYLGWERHWEEINSMMADTCASDCNVLLSIHPRSDLSQYRYLEDKYSCRIAEERLAHIIGAGDLFLASNSTTFHWAVLCGVPSVALMSPVPFLFGYLETIRTVEPGAGLLETIHQTLESSSLCFDNDWALLSRDAVFDGRFNERFVQFLNEIC